MSDSVLDPEYFYYGNTADASKRTGMKTRFAGTVTTTRRTTTETANLFEQQRDCLCQTHPLLRFWGNISDAEAIHEAHTFSCSTKFSILKRFSVLHPKGNLRVV